MTDEYNPHPELFDLAEATLAALSAGESVFHWITRFELGTFRLLGQLPSLDACVECGAAVPMAGRVAFGYGQGGVLCGRCRNGKTQVASLSAGVLRAMAALADPENRSWQRLEFAPRTRGELRGALNHYLYAMLGRKPRMHQYLGVLTGS